MKMNDISRKGFLAGLCAAIAGTSAADLCEFEYKNAKMKALDTACENLRRSFKQHIAKYGEPIHGEPYEFFVGTLTPDGTMKPLPLWMKAEEWTGTDEIDCFVEYVRKHIDEPGFDVCFRDSRVVSLMSFLIFTGPERTLAMNSVYAESGIVKF